ncbi:MAG TPA: hypothetical protein PKM41_09455 [Deltaproteobacteria bacterium]|jgi:hypothetical protein|nr:hypothetical protein [Deltaproteobacteria bacterium]HOI08582.1 hypothetical protein [Deltaproteobacteria bacterium]
MGFLFRLIAWLIVAPFKLVKFIVADVLIFGIIGGTLTVVKAVLRFFFKPLILAAVAGGAAAFIFSDEERRNKVRALIGM